MKHHRIARILISLAIFLFFALQIRGVISVNLIDRLENISYDNRINLTTPDTIDTSVVIVDLDTASLNRYGRWPWSRNLVAEMLNILFDEYNVQFVAFDVLFGEQDNSSGMDSLLRLATGKLRKNKEFLNIVTDLKDELSYDQIFADSLASHTYSVALGFTESNNGQHGLLPEPLYQLSENDKNWARELYELPGVDANLPILQKAAGNAGLFSNQALDKDGIFRRVPLIVKYKGDIYESLPLTVVRTIYGLDKVEFELANQWLSDKRWLEAVTAPGLRIPVTPDGAVMVPYRGKSGSFQYISAKNILNRSAPKELLENMIVLVGTTAPGLMDLRSTPMQGAYPGVEIHANVISGILDDRIKTVPSYYDGFKLISVITIGALLLLVYPFLSPLWVTIKTISLLAIYNGLILYAWQYEDLVLPNAHANVLILVFFVTHITYGFFTERKVKQEITRVFGQYVPKEVVNQLSQNPNKLGLHGESRFMTVLFSDVRSFTTISEGLNPQQLKELMNAYLTPVTKLIYEHRGTVDKYIGDAVMAFWGAPVHSDRHAHDAVLAGLHMLEVAEKMRASFKAKGWPELYIGVGINTGFMNVGNMGSEYRVAYTVLGDAVNLGSRLEGLTKLYGVELIVSEFTKEQAPDFIYRELDRVRVKGKGEPVTIYEPLGLKEEVSLETRDALRRYNEAMDDYRNRKWDSAEHKLQKLIETEGEHRLYTLYIDRIQHYREIPPEDDWDKVYTLTSK